MSDKDGGFPLTEADLPALALGAGVLGTGGGGNPYIGMLRTRQMLRGGAHVRILPLGALPGDARVGAVGSIGAPVVGVEKIKQGAECLRALRAVEAASGVSVAALISEEIGGANALEPVIAAAQAGLPVLDGDGMGRAFPELQMTSFSIYGRDVNPGAIADVKGNVIVFQTVSDMLTLERFARRVAIEMGASAGFATSTMTADFVHRTAIPGTLSQALAIGRAVLDARAHRHDVVDRIIAETGARALFTGKVTDIRRELKGGFAVGEAVLAGIGDHTGAEARIAIQNEYLILWIDGTVTVTVPDLIMLLERETGEPITTEVLRYGQRLAVIGMPAHPLMTSEAALKVVGPKAFGYKDIDFNPIT
jgi:DUF917 family protein